MGRIKAHHPRRLRPADGATAGTPVVDEDYYRHHPRPEGGWPLDQWRLAPGRDTDPDLAQYVATELEEHLGLVVLDDYEPVVKPIHGKPVTMHYYLRTDWDGERDIDFFQAEPGAGTPPGPAPAAGTDPSPYAGVLGCPEKPAAGRPTHHRADGPPGKPSW
jgi:hypothetical protein